MKTNNNSNRTNIGLNADIYEEQAVNRSKVARNAALGASLVAAGGIGGAVAAHAAGSETMMDDEATLSMEDVVEGGNVGGEYVEENTVREYQYVEKPVAPVEETPVEETPEVVWDETTTLYNTEGERIGSIETGKVQGHDFALIDGNNDNVADVLVIDENDNHIIEDHEVHILSPGERIAMGNPTKSENVRILFSDEEERIAEYEPYEKDPIHNDFEDEKTGERYYADYAEDNPDYNPNYGYQASAENLPLDGTPSLTDEELALMNMEDENEPDAFDSMMASDEFLG